MKKRIINILIVLIGVAVVALCVIKIYDSKKINQNLLEKKVVHDITFDNIKIEKKGTKYKYSVTLSSDKKIEVEGFDAEFKDDKGKSIEILSGYIGSLNPNETKIIEIETDKKINKANEVIYTVYNK